MNNAVKYNSGFTLIELVTVITILGILAVTALPKFINVSSDARASVVSSVAGAMKSASSMSYAKSSMRNQQNQPTSQINVDNTNIPIVYGYPGAHSGIMKLLDIGTVGNYGKNSINSNYDWVVHYWNWTVSGQQVPAIVIAQGVVTGDSDATAPLDTKCYIRYVQATSTRPFEVVSDTSGC